jgi:hypothetical protein
MRASVRHVEGDLAFSVDCSDIYESATDVEARRFSHRVGKVQCPINPY